MFKNVEGSRSMVNMRWAGGGIAVDLFLVTTVKGALSAEREVDSGCDVDFLLDLIFFFH